MNDNKTRIAIYPGSFDPITNGHIDIIKRAAGIFDKLVVLISCNPQKEQTPVNQRVELAKTALSGFDNVSIDFWDGLTAEYAYNVNACAIIRGLRAVSDFDYEVQMALANKALYGKADTIFLTASADNMFLSSSMVKQIASFGGNISQFVPKCVETYLKEIYKV